MKRGLCLCAAAVLFAAFGAAGCGADEEPEKEKVLRVLEPDFKYETTHYEHTVEYDDNGKDITISGTVYEPDTGGRFPAVILSHGFNGHGADFKKECLRFAERGYVCYAFDFCGAQASSKSKGRTEEEYTPFTMKEDLLHVIEEIGKFSNVDKSQIFLFGGSQGGFVTMLTAADSSVKDKIAGVATYFPALNIPDDWRGKPEEKTPLMGYYIGAEFIRSVQDLDPYEVIGDYKGDVCIVWGTNDALVHRNYIDRAVETYGADRAELTVLEGAGHGFGGTDLAEAIETVLAFLEARTYTYK